MFSQVCICPRGVGGRYPWSLVHWSIPGGIPWALVLILLAVVPSQGCSWVEGSTQVRPVLAVARERGTPVTPVARGRGYPSQACNWGYPWTGQRCSTPSQLFQTPHHPNSNRIRDTPTMDRIRGIPSRQTRKFIENSFMIDTRFDFTTKTVLLRDCNRRTARCVASTRSAVLSSEGYPSPSQGVPQSQLAGVPQSQSKGYAYPLWGTPSYRSNWGISQKEPGTRDQGMDMGLGLPLPRDEQTENIPSVVLRARAIKMALFVLGWRTL